MNLLNFAANVIYRKAVQISMINKFEYYKIFNDK